MPTGLDGIDCKHQIDDGFFKIGPAFTVQKRNDEELEKVGDNDRLTAALSVLDADMAQYVWLTHQ